MTIVDAASTRGVRLLHRLLGLFRANEDKSVSLCTIECSTGESLGSSIIISNSVHCLSSEAAPFLSIKGNGYIKHIPMRSGRKCAGKETPGIGMP